MARQLTTRAQVSGYRFGLARAEHALIRRDVRMVHDPMRAQSRALLAGAVLAVLLLAGAGIYGIVRPASSVAGAQIVLTDEGGLFVLVDEVMHPVPNLASARLIVGRALPAKRATARSISAYPRGAALGIPGAPAAVPGPGDADLAAWTVCDDPAAGTAVIAGPPSLPPAAAAMRAARAGALVSIEGEQWLLYTVRRDGALRPVRARVTESPAVRRVLGLEGVQPRPVSPGLFNAFPAEPELAVPPIAGRGSPGPGPLRDIPVGTVIRSVGVDDSRAYFVVLADGVQPLTAPAAEILRGADAASPESVRQVSPGVLTAVAVIRRLPVTGFPAAVPELIAADAVLCRAWQSTRSPGAPSEERLIATPHLPLPPGAQVVALAAADGDGPGLDGVYLQPGTGEHAAVTGGSFYVTDTGIRHRVADDETAGVLGLPPAARAPWPVLSLLPAGPDLDRTAALVARDLPR